MDVRAIVAPVFTAQRQVRARPVRQGGEAGELLQQQQQQHLQQQQQQLLAQSPVLRLQRAGGAGEVMRDLRRLHERESFADVRLVAAAHNKPSSARKRASAAAAEQRSNVTSAHGLLLGASSELLRTWLAEAAPTPSMEATYTVILPDVDMADLEILLSVLYGADVALHSDVAARVTDAADLLGVTVDLPFKTFSDDATQAQQQLQQQQQQPPPICCWHCNAAFRSLAELKIHIQSHQGERLKRKQHRCQHCKKVLPSMWRLRQHLLTHKTAPSSSSSPKGRPPLSSPSKAAAPAQAGPMDHAYAGHQESTTPQTQEPPPEKESQHPASAAAAALATSDHQYSSHKARTPPPPEQPQTREEQQQQLQVRLKKIDHLYSSPSSPASPAAGASQQGGGGGGSALGKGKKKKPGAKRQSIQALGHSYAAARPRRISGGPLPDGEGKRRGASTQAMFPCDQCDKEFPQPYRLNRHIREVHVKERIHSCDLCDKSFFKVTSMERHRLTHMEHQLWKCQKCQKCFRDQTSLKYHTTRNVCTKRKKAAAAAKENNEKSAPPPHPPPPPSDYDGFPAVYVVNTG